MKVQRDGRQITVTVRADGDDQTVNHAGAALLAETADRLGLTGALSARLAGLRQRRGGHDPGRVVRDLAVMLAVGGDALCDLRSLRDQRIVDSPRCRGPALAHGPRLRCGTTRLQGGIGDIDVLGVGTFKPRHRCDARHSRPCAHVSV